MSPSLVRKGESAPTSSRGSDLSQVAAEANIQPDMGPNASVGWKLFPPLCTVGISSNPQPLAPHPARRSLLLSLTFSRCNLSTSPGCALETCLPCGGGELMVMER